MQLDCQFIQVYTLMQPYLKENHWDTKINYFEYSPSTLKSHSRQYIIYVHVGDNQ